MPASAVAVVEQPTVQSETESPRLTLAGRPVTLRAISEYEYSKYRAKKERIRREVVKNYPAITAPADASPQEREAAANHPDNEEADADYSLFALRIPLIQACWDGPGCPSPEEIAAATPAGQIDRVIAAILELNPGLAEFPGN